MGHVVVHRDAQGAWQLEDMASLDAALERVETLRNVEQRDEVRLLDEIALEVRTYYRVALAEDRNSPPVTAAAPAPPAPSAPVEDRAQGEADEGVASEPDLEPRPASAAPTGVAELPMPSWDPGPSPAAEEKAGAGDQADNGSSAAASAPPPGTFPLAAPPVPASVAVEGDQEREVSGVGGRRGSRFTRDR